MRERPPQTGTPKAGTAKDRIRLKSDHERRGDWYVLILIGAYCLVVLLLNIGLFVLCCYIVKWVFMTAGG